MGSDIFPGATGRFPAAAEREPKPGTKGRILNATCYLLLFFLRHLSLLLATLFDEKLLSATLFDENFLLLLLSPLVKFVFFSEPRIN